MLSRRSSAVLAAAAYLGAGAAALFAGGPLSLPGAAVSLACVLLLFRLPEATVALGSLAAAGSFAGQALHYGGVCPPCLIGASLFAAGSFISVLLSKRQVLAALFLVLPVFAAGFLARTVAQSAETALPQVRQEAWRKAPLSEKTQAGLLEKNCQVYFSPWCKYCPSVLEKFVSLDPEGVWWAPVAVPHSSLETGKEELKALGYTGRVWSAPEAPGGALPSVVYEGKVYTGKSDALAAARSIEKLILMKEAKT